MFQQCNQNTIHIPSFHQPRVVPTSAIPKTNAVHKVHKGHPKNPSKFCCSYGWVAVGQETCLVTATRQDTSPATNWPWSPPSETKNKCEGFFNTLKFHSNLHTYFLDFSSIFSLVIQTPMYTFYSFLMSAIYNL